MEPAAAGDETRRAIAKPSSTRAAFVVELAERVKVLTLAGDLEGARVAVEALQRLLGAAPSKLADVLDLASRRPRDRAEGASPPKTRR